MKVLIVEDNSTTLWSRKLWIFDASVLSKCDGSTSIVLAIHDTICNPEATTKQPDLKSLIGQGRCAGMIEGADEDLRLLRGAGYVLNDIRNVSASELLKTL
jgi:hypothetical protein